MIEPHKYPEVKSIGNTLSAMHEVVGGFPDGYPIEEDAFIAFDEDAKADAKEGNRRYADEIFTGIIAIVRWNEEKQRFQSLTDAQIEAYSRMFHEPEEIPVLEVMESLAMEPYE